MMRRREFITLLSGATAAWPLAAWAQQQTMPVVGYLNTQFPDAATGRVHGFRQGLKKTGFEGRKRRVRVLLGRGWN
jgi:putative ABC transport system substrate-binding protein